MAAAIMVDKTDLQALGFTVSKSADIIRAAKRLMASKGYGFYGSRKVGRVPASAAAEIIGVDLTGAAMPKISNVYRDKRNGTWYFFANLGTDAQGKRVRHRGRGYTTQRETKAGYDEHMAKYSKTAVKVNSTMSFGEFFRSYWVPDYRGRVRIRSAWRCRAGISRVLTRFACAT